MQNTQEVYARLPSNITSRAIIKRSECSSLHVQTVYLNADCSFNEELATLSTAMPLHYSSITSPASHASFVLVHAVNQWRIRDSNKNGVLATSSSSNNLFAAYGGVVDHGRSLDVLDSALARLVVAGEAPRVGLAISGDGKVIIRSCRDGYDVLDICRVVNRKNKYDMGNRIVPSTAVGRNRIRAWPRSS